MNSLFIVWEQLQVLIGHQLPELRDVLFDLPLVMLHLEL